MVPKRKGAVGGADSQNQYQVSSLGAAGFAFLFPGSAGGIFLGPTNVLVPPEASKNKQHESREVK